MQFETYQINKTKPWVVRVVLYCVTVQIFGDPPSGPVLEHHTTQIRFATWLAVPLPLEGLYIPVCDMLFSQWHGWKWWTLLLRGSFESQQGYYFDLSSFSQWDISDRGCSASSGSSVWVQRDDDMERNHSWPIMDIKVRNKSCFCKPRRFEEGSFFLPLHGLA